MLSPITMYALLFCLVKRHVASLVASAKRVLRHRPLWAVRPQLGASLLFANQYDAREAPLLR